MEPLIFSIEERTHLVFRDEAMGKSYNEIKQEDLIPAVFGADYGGNFTLRYPTLGDRAKIDAVLKREFRKAGYTILEDVAVTIHNQEYAFAVVEVLAEPEGKPAWFDKDKLSSDTDQLAVGEVGLMFNELVQSKKKKATST